MLAHSSARGGGGAFVAAYTPDFDFRWVWLNPAAYGVSTVPLAADRIVVAGSFGGTIDLGGGTPFTATRPVDVFVVMLGPS